MSFIKIQEFNNELIIRYGAGIESIVVDEVVFYTLLKDVAATRMYDPKYIAGNLFSTGTLINFNDIIITKGKNSEINRVTTQIKELQEKLDKLKSNDV